MDAAERTHGAAHGRESSAVRAPSALLLAAEQRAVLELGAFVAASPLLRMAGRGDRHPVLVLPGFTAGDRSTVPLRWFLRSQGWWAHGWHLGPNFGPTRRIVTGIQERLDELHGLHGRTVSIVGWSLGGIYARELARRKPDAVRTVITLGSPFRMVDGDRSWASSLYDSFSPAHRAELLRIAQHEEERDAISVPTTAIYSRTDGIVRWHTCIDRVSPRHENVEVHGSHSGLGHNPTVLAVIADRLAQPEGRWRPFKPVPWAAYWYPKPADWHP
ncbi:MAG TPA: alpha/beta hydrolase [Acidimicrobiales bacterium]|nr:alpha/beta hydrolase [Acidimicrobiales bacterium]